jgi:hypothetical protein
MPIMRNDRQAGNGAEWGARDAGLS